ncbi:MAG: L,D-transpeptidase family protein [Sphingomonas sp.]|uniref:L,D-transpeptidase family protein n=1 Tax=Sphingomonas sp. TaxID=28214 RepID=UPI0017AC95B5|nr:L,D-transpeptidase family protein [Sphingomonas sp.]MBA3667960.1 L,D-transpeptidase family protein [Sphingomonas sp.]
MIRRPKAGDRLGRGKKTKMKTWFKQWALFATLAAVPLATALAQSKPAADPIAPLPDAAVQPVTAPVLPPPPPLPPPLWQAPQVAALGAYIRGVARDGLDPADYDPAGLDAAMRGGDPIAMSEAATDRWNKLSSDLALGHVRGDARIDWHVVDKDIDATRQRMLLDRALYDNGLAEALDSLLPTHPQYGALRTALSLTPKTDVAKTNRIRLNLDRWRWLPRDLGQKYIIVNVPAYHATLVENGVTRWKHRAIAGAIKTPTPQLSAMATGVILNPWWEVPTSISKEVAGKSGFVAVKGKDGKVQRWRQPPGPTNALGQLKFVMQNQWAIYLHDTNARSRFNSSIRALSHGCVRTENVLDLATELLGDDAGEWTGQKVQEALADKKSVQASFVKPVPVYIVYFSAAALTDGTIVNYNDVYRRDTRVIAALLDNDGKAPATTAPAKKTAAR